MSHAIKKLHFWWGWDMDKFENYLNTMQEKGYELYDADCSLIRLYFSKGTPSKITYSVDYQAEANPEYRQILEDDG